MYPIDLLSLLSTGDYDQFLVEVKRLANETEDESIVDLLFESSLIHDRRLYPHEYTTWRSFIVFDEMHRLFSFVKKDTKNRTKYLGALHRYVCKDIDTSDQISLLMKIRALYALHYFESSSEYFDMFNKLDLSPLLDSVVQRFEGKMLSAQRDPAGITLLESLVEQSQSSLHMIDLANAYEWIHNARYSYDRVRAELVKRPSDSNLGNHLYFLSKQLDLLDHDFLLIVNSLGNARSSNMTFWIESRFYNYHKLKGVGIILKRYLDGTDFKREWSTTYCKYSRFYIKNSHSQGIKP